MTIVTQAKAKRTKQNMEIPNIPMLQARLARDGSDDDIKRAFSEDALRKANVADRTARLKSLIRMGIQAEQTGVLNENSYFVFDGHDLAPAAECIVAQIGTNRFVIRK